MPYSNVNGQFNNDIGFPSGVVSTTDGTTTVSIFQKQAFFNNSGSDAAGVFTFDIVGIDFANSQVASAKIVAKIKKVSSTLSVEGVPVHLVPFNANSSSGLVTCSATVTVSGSNVRVSVIGVTGKTIYWTCKVSPSLEVLDDYDAAATPADTDLLTWNDGYGRWDPLSRTDIIDGVPAGGDLSGTYPNPTVVKLQGRTLDSTAPSSGQLIMWNGSQWSVTTMGGDVTGTPAASIVTKIQNRTVSSTAPSDGDFLSYSTASSKWELVGGVSPFGPVYGDLTGDYPYPTVIGITGSAVSSSRQVIVGGGTIAVGQYFIISPEDQTVSSGSVHTGGGTSMQISGARGDSLGASALLRAGGIVTIEGGDGYSDGVGGNVNLISGTSSLGAAGDIELFFGDGTGSTVGKLNLNNIKTTSTATGGAATLPGNPVGFISVNLGSTTYKMPYYNT